MYTQHALNRTSHTLSQNRLASVNLYITIYPETKPKSYAASCSPTCVVYDSQSSMLQILLWKMHQTPSLSFFHAVSPCPLTSSSCTWAITVSAYPVSLPAASMPSSETMSFTSKNLQWLPTTHEKKSKLLSLAERPCRMQAHLPLRHSVHPPPTAMDHSPLPVFTSYVFTFTAHIIVSIPNTLPTTPSFASSLSFHSEMTSEKSALILGSDFIASSLGSYHVLLVL